MAIIWMDGPDHYGSNAALLSDGVYAQVSHLSLVPNSGPGGIGTVFLHGDYQPSSLRKVLPGVRDAVGIGMRFYFNALNLTTIYVFRDINNATIGTLDMLSTGALRYTKIDGTVLFQTDPLIVANSWQFIEMFVDFKLAATGHVRLGVDSITVVSIDSISTLTAANSNSCAQIYQTMFSVRTRDFYIWDTTGDLNNSGMQGDRQVITVYPTADGDANDWVPSTGTHGFSLINETPPDDTTFITASTSGLKSDFQVGDIDTDITSISAAMVVARMKKSDAGIGTVKMGAKSAGVEGFGAELALSTQFIYYGSILEKDPATGNKWTPNGINNAQIIVDRVE